ncbi:serine/threonine protein kinase [Stigmatella aurantiaca]|uniref:non-specific serine/threonine protein kinase n=1 Tax=Stigmatella aurantiaca TaxID=41 RepID=A0A1H7MR32_STIAU|nr:protein kinase [Stigmatella aurantiaca]SEL13571.1 serine/threonine protein kinase [Stigmatella aurantiaca]
MPSFPDASMTDAKTPPNERIQFVLGDITYETVRPLAQRENGEVIFLAERRLRHGPSDPVTIKRMKAPASFERRLRLIQEVELAFRLSHPAIAPVHHLMLRDGMPHVIEEYVEGPSLDTVIHLATVREQPVSLPFALYVAAEAADALHHAHTRRGEDHQPLGIVHRDVSPRNIRMDRNGDVKVMNFGAAYSHLVGREETPGLLLKDDVAYASPEYLHRRPMDGRSDLFSLGLVLLQLLTNRRLFELEDAQAPAQNSRAEDTLSTPLLQMMTFINREGTDDLERAAGHLPEALRAILHRALQVQPSGRYASASEMHGDLKAVLRANAQPFGRFEAREELALMLAEAAPPQDA